MATVRFGSVIIETYHDSAEDFTQEFFKLLYGKSIVDMMNLYGTNIEDVTKTCANHLAPMISEMNSLPVHVFNYKK